MKFILCATMLCLPGCVTKPREPRPGETDEQRIHREVFYTDWVRPSVTQEDVDFFYEPLWKTR